MTLELEPLLLSVFVEGDPVAQPRPRAWARKGPGGKVTARMYDAGTAKPWRERIAAAVLPLRPEAPLDGPLSLELTFLMRRPKSHFRKSGTVRESAPTHPTGKPDIDNLVKAITDELTQLSVWQDDSQVVCVYAKKLYTVLAERPGLHLAVMRAGF